MASIIDASTAGVGGIITTADNSGNLNIQSGGSTKIAVTSAGAAVTGTLSTTSTINGVTVGTGGGSISTNTAVGSLAGNSNTTGYRNSFFGYQSGYSNTTAIEHTFIGHNSGYSNAVSGNTTGSSTMIGYYSGYGATTGIQNTFIGAYSGYSVTTGAKNTILGVYSGNQGGLDIRTSSNNVVLSDGDGNPLAGVNSSKWFWANQGGATTGYYTQTHHRFMGDIAQGGRLFVISAYPTGGEDTLKAYSVNVSGASAAASAIEIGKNSSTSRSINAGGTINASGADYAEYMTKADDFVLAKGDLVGIDANGKLTNVFADAVSFVVKSTDPSYVGGDNWFTEKAPDAPTTDATEEYIAQYELNKADFDARLEAARQLVDRIAFAGQVPVNVLGATAGQYIIPMNDNGTIKGEAVTSPTFDQYQSSVGKVIAIEADGRAKIIVKVA